MHVFYAPKIKAEKYILDKKESKHCVKVLRLRKSEPVKLIDGEGNLYDGVIAELNPEGCVINITNIIKDYQKRPYKLHLAVSPLKNPDRFDWLIEKSVEIGVDEITPLICTNSEKKSIRPERINNIIISAMKQSIKARLTFLNPVTSFSEFVRKDFTGIQMIAHCSTGYTREHIKNIYSKGHDAVLLIGPEGDFTDDEIREAISMGFISIHLGPSRLRTETAAVAACYSVYFLNL